MTQAEPQSWAVAGRLLLAFFLLILYIPFLVTPNHFSWIDHVNLALHEGGHVVFSPFGEFLMMFGGTLMQLAIPIACAVHFWKKEESTAFGLMVWWTGENLLNISIYIADARRQELPLVAGGVHDWTWLLETVGLLTRNDGLARAVFWLGTGVMLWAVLVIVRDGIRR